MLLNNKTLSVNTCDEIQKENRELLEITTHGLKIADKLDCLQNNDSAKSFAVCIQGSIIDLIKARSDLRGTVQLVMEIQKYKPALDSTSKSKMLWTNINDSCKNIFKTTVDTMVISAKYMSFLMRIANSLVSFKEYQSKKIDGKFASIELSIAPLYKDMNEFFIFKNEYDKAIEKSRDVALASIYKCVDSFIGEKEIKDSQDNLKKWEQERLIRITELKKLELERLKDLMPLREKCTPLISELEALKVRIQYACGNEHEYASAMKKAREKAQKFDEEAVNSSDYKITTYTSYEYNYRPYYWRWWWGYGGYYSRDAVTKTSSTYTGDKTKNKEQADHQRNVEKNYEAKMIKTQKEKENAQKRKKELEELINPILEEIKAQTAFHKKKISAKKKELKNVQEKYDKALSQITKACEQTGVQEENVVDFLSLTSQMLTASMEMMERTATVNENMKLFYTLIKRKATTCLTIEDYFSGHKLTRFIEPLHKAELFLMKDLECDSKEEFNKEILPELKKNNNDIPRNVAKTLLQLCIDEDTIEKWKEDEKIMKLRNRDILMNEVPPLSIFFNEIYKRLKIAIENLKMVKSNENKQILFEAKKRMEKIELNNQKAIKYYQDNDNSSDSSTSNDDLINLKKLNTKKLIKFINNLNISSKYIKELKRGIKNNEINGRQLLKCKNSKNIRKLFDKEISEKTADKFYNCIKKYLKNDTKNDIKIIKEKFLFDKLKNDKIKCLDEDFEKICFELPQDTSLLKKIKKAEKKSKKDGIDFYIIVQSKKNNNKYLEKRNVIDFEFEKQNDTSSTDSDTDSSEEANNKSKKRKKKLKKNDMSSDSDNEEKIKSKKNNDISSDSENEENIKSKKKKKKLKNDVSSGSDNEENSESKKRKTKSKKKNNTLSDSDDEGHIKSKKTKRNKKKIENSSDDEEKSESIDSDLD